MNDEDRKWLRNHASEWAKRGQTSEYEADQFGYWVESRYGDEPLSDLPSYPAMEKEFLADPNEKHHMQAETLGEAETKVEEAAEETADAAEGTGEEHAAESVEDAVFEQIADWAEEVEAEAEQVEAKAEEVAADPEASPENKEHAEHAADVAHEAAEEAREAKDEAEAKAEEDHSDTITPEVTHFWFKDKLFRR